MSDEQKKEGCHCCNRRQAIKLGAMASASLLIAGGLTGCGDPALLEEDVIITLADYPKLADIGGIAEVPTSTSGFSHKIIVIREGEMDYRAMSAECNHASCDVDLSGGEFVCPCHGSKFALDGTKTKGPATADLANFDTQLDGESLTIKA